MGGSSSRENNLTNDIWRPRPYSRDSFPSFKDIQDDGGKIRGKGTKVYVFKQDPTVEVIGSRELWLLERVHRGPRTTYLSIEGMPSNYGSSDTDGNFLYKPNLNEDAFDAVHTLAVVSHVRMMYIRALKRVGSRRELNWNFDGPIKMLPLAGEDENAYYDRQEKTLAFFYFYDDHGKKIKVCRSWDVVSHETGHAVLDFLQPHWMPSMNPETKALHETFGDMTAILSVLDQMDMCEAIVTHSKGDLRNRDNMLAVIAEEFAFGIGKPFGLRNATVDLTMSRATTEHHDLSRVFTGAVYDIMVTLFENSLDVERQTPAESLYFAARHILSLFLVAILEAPAYNAKFAEVANIMIKKEPEALFKDVIRKEFTRREIFDKWAKPIVADHLRIIGNFEHKPKHICTTLLKMKGSPGVQNIIEERPHEESASATEGLGLKFCLLIASAIGLVAYLGQKYAFH